MELIDAVKTAGVVGAGGAGFPTHVKLKTNAEFFIINAAECEPLIETDKYLCRTFPMQLIESAQKIAAHLGAKRTVIALKGKYKTEIAALEKAIKAIGAEVEIFKMGTFYPAGDEQIIVQLVCGVSVPERGIPIDVGAVVDNVGTVLNIGDALNGKPVTEKYLSVVGEVCENKILRVPVGISITECIEAAKPNIKDYAVIVGGPMMGKILVGNEILTTAVTKTTGNIIVLSLDHYLIERQAVPMSRVRLRAKSACIQCRMCTDLCPRYNIGHQIRPHLVMRNVWREQSIENSTEFKNAFGEAANCCDCGVCEMFSCPMGLSPRKVNVYMKTELRRRGIDVEKNQKIVAREDVNWHRVPTGRLVSRLGLHSYYGKPLAQGYTKIMPKTVHIPLSQHIGKPAVPIKTLGDRVWAGELVAQADDSGLSANIHASITGIITDLTDKQIEIRREEE